MDTRETARRSQCSDKSTSEGQPGVGVQGAQLAAQPIHKVVSIGSQQGLPGGVATVQANRPQGCSSAGPHRGARVSQPLQQHQHHLAHDDTTAGKVGAQHPGKDPHCLQQCPDQDSILPQDLQQTGVTVQQANVSVQQSGHIVQQFLAPAPCWCWSMIFIPGIGKACLQATTGRC